MISYMASFLINPENRSLGLSLFMEKWNSRSKLFGKGKSWRSQLRSRAEAQSHSWGVRVTLSPFCSHCKQPGCVIHGRHCKPESHLHYFLAVWPLIGHLTFGPSDCSPVKWDESVHRRELPWRLKIRPVVHLAQGLEHSEYTVTIQTKTSAAKTLGIYIKRILGKKKISIMRLRPLAFPPNESSFSQEMSTQITVSSIKPSLH